MTDPNPPAAPGLGGPPFVSAKDSAIRRRVAIGTSVNMVGKAIRTLTWFFLTAFIVNQLGPTQYGVWVLVGSVASYGSLLDLGVAGAVVKYVAQHMASGDPASAARIISTALWVYIGLGLIALLAALAVAPLFSSFFRIPEGQAGMAQAVVVLTGVSLAISIPSTAAPSVLLGLQRYDVLNLISTVSTLVSAVAIVVVLLLGGGLIGMVALNIPIALATQAVSVAAIRRLVPALRFGLRGASLGAVKSIIAYSSFSFGFQIAGLLQRQTDEMVIGRFLAISAVTPYAIGRRASEFVLLVTDQFMRVLLPLASQLDAEADRERLRGLYLTSTRLTLALSLPIGAALIVLAEPLIVAWLGPQYLDAAPILIVLTASSMIGLTQWPAGAILQGMARHQVIAVSALLTGVANLIISVILVQRIGVLGVALGTLIPTVVETLVFVLPYTTRRLDVRLLDVWRSCFVPALLPVIPAVLVMYGIRELIGPTTLVAVGVIAVAGGLTYGLLYLRFGAGPLERDLVATIWRQIRTRRLTRAPVDDVPPAVAPRNGG